MTQTADQILREAADAIGQRAALRDLPQGERSMSRAVAIFAAATGRKLSELEGWTFMICLKLARANAGANHLDDYTDLAGYAALAGECLHQADSLPAAIATPATEGAQEPGEVRPVGEGDDGFMEYCLSSPSSLAREGGDICYVTRCNNALAHVVLNELLKSNTVAWCRENVFFDGLFLNIRLSYGYDTRQAEIKLHDGMIERARATLNGATEAVAG